MATDIHAPVKDPDQHYGMRRLSIDEVVGLIRYAEIGLPKSGNFPAIASSLADFLKVAPGPKRVCNRLIQTPTLFGVVEERVEVVSSPRRNNQGLHSAAERRGLRSMNSSKSNGCG